VREIQKRLQQRWGPNAHVSSAEAEKSMKQSPTHSGSSLQPLCIDKMTPCLKREKTPFVTSSGRGSQRTTWDWVLPWCLFSNSGPAEGLRWDAISEAIVNDVKLNRTSRWTVRSCSWRHRREQLTKLTRRRSTQKEGDGGKEERKEEELKRVRQDRLLYNLPAPPLGRGNDTTINH
jgi:hypothetical protein